MKIFIAGANGQLGHALRGALRDHEIMAYGIEELYLSVIEGIGAAMPPRGMCTDCSDSQLKRVVDFMIRDLE